jgi:hypothetical protein
MPAAAKKKFSMDAAPVIAPPPKAAGKNDPVSYEMPGTADLVTMRRFEAIAKSGRMLLEEDLKASGRLKHVELGCKIGKRPENWIGTEGVSKANFVFSKRSTRSVVTPEQIVLFTEQFGAEWVAKNLDTVTPPPTYAIPEKYINNPVWRARIEDAISKIKLSPGEELPKDIIVKLQDDTTVTVSDATVDAIFEDRDPEVAELFLPLVTTLGLKVAKAENIDMAALLTNAGRILNLPNLKEKLTQAAIDPETVMSEDFGKPKKASKRK